MSLLSDAMEKCIFIDKTKQGVVFLCGETIPEKLMNHGLKIVIKIVDIQNDNGFINNSQLF